MTLAEQRAHNEAESRRYRSWMTRERMTEAAKAAAASPEEMPPTGRGPRGASSPSGSEGSDG